MPTYREILGATIERLEAEVDASHVRSRNAARRGRAYLWLSALSALCVAALLLLQGGD